MASSNKKKKKKKAVNVPAPAVSSLQVPENGDVDAGIGPRVRKSKSMDPKSAHSRHELAASKAQDSTLSRLHVDKDVLRTKKAGASGSKSTENFREALHSISLLNALIPHLEALLKLSEDPATSRCVDVDGNVLNHAQLLAVSGLLYRIVRDAEGCGSARLTALQLDHPDVAERHFVRALEQEFNVVANFHLASIYSHSTESSKRRIAIGMFEKHLAVTCDWSALVRLGDLHVMSGDWMEAHQTYRYIQ